MSAEDIKKYFKNNYKEDSARQHVTKEHATINDHQKAMLKASMEHSKEYTAEELNLINYKLKQFDLNMKFGPVSGLLRSERWQRAQTLNLNPPQEIKDHLQDPNLSKQIPDIDYHLWSGIIDFKL